MRSRRANSTEEKGGGVGHDGAPPTSSSRDPFRSSTRVLDLTVTFGGGGGGGPRRTAAPTELPQLCFTEENTPIVQNDLESHLV